MACGRIQIAGLSVFLDLKQIENIEYLTHIACSVAS
jgi:hypothetical protein